MSIADPAGPTTETMTVGGTNLGSVTFGQDYVDDTRTVTFNATMVATTVGSGSSQATQIIITLTSVATGSSYLNDVGDRHRHHALDTVRVGQGHLRERLHDGSGHRGRSRRCRSVSR